MVPIMKKIEIIEDETGIRYGLDLLMEHYAGKGEYQYDERVLKKTFVLRLKVHRLWAKSHGFRKE